MYKTIGILLLMLSSCTTFAWNSAGHQIVAQIAYDQLTPETKMLVNNYNKALEGNSKYSNFVRSAVWLDILKLKEVRWYDHLHYIDIPYSIDESPLIKPQQLNALWAIKKSLAVLNSSKTSKKDKGLSLRILIHVVGDIHQPMHAVTQISKLHPDGDMGGNLFQLAPNSVGKNLHAYWDNGAGILIGAHRGFQIRNKAKQLEERWSCANAGKDNAPLKWIDQSHRIAIDYAYKVRQGSVPSKYYQMTAQNIVEKQMFLAGCRLGALLNQMKKPRA